MLFFSFHVCSIDFLPFFLTYHFYNLYVCAAAFTTCTAGGGDPYVYPYVPVPFGLHNGTRSDVVLETKSSVSNLPRFFAEVQHTVYRMFIKRVMDYSLETDRKWTLLY